MEQLSTPVYCNAWGMANKGQLGCISQQPRVINAIRIPNVQDVGYFEVSCGENHTLLLTDALEILTCGSNTYGQLGIGQSALFSPA